MLAGTLEDTGDLKFPVYCTPKLDGIRCLMVGGQALSRKFKPIPNHHIRRTLEKVLPNGFDGEIMIPGADFNDVQSNVMRMSGEPDFEYHVFDYVKDSLRKPYIDRLTDLADWYADNADLGSIVQQVQPAIVEDLGAFFLLEKRYLEQGYEGIMIRSGNGPYKCGRSTVREGSLLKFKRFVDAEAVITGFQEQMENTNDAEKDAFGRTKRSSAKDGMVPKGTLGAVEVDYNGASFTIGSGFNDEQRADIWKNKKKYLGKTINFTYQDAGKKNLPRFPIFRGFRPEYDQ
jgi:DNA ligase-1